MPISQEEFEQERIDLSVPIADILADRPDLAFTAEEVGPLLVHITARSATVDDVREALDRLASVGSVQRKDIAGQRWYTGVRNRLGFLR